jgi:hypothetical protein
MATIVGLCAYDVRVLQVHPKPVPLRILTIVQMDQLRSSIGDDEKKIVVIGLGDRDARQNPERSDDLREGV